MTGSEVLVWWLLPLSALAAEPPPGGWPPPPPHGFVKSVYDGDTFTLESGDKIRLKWVNTPEMRPEEPFAKDAKALAERMILNQEVKLVLDSANARDGYGRVVAGVTTPTGDLSEALVREGLAHVFVIPPDSLDLTRLLAAQDEARAARRGIWSTDAFQGALHITSFHANAPGDDNLNPNGEYLRIANIAAGPVDLDGWRLVDRSGDTWRMTGVVVPAGHTVKVMVGRGTNQTDPSRQLELYLGNAEAAFSNEHEVVELYDPTGRKVDFRESHGSGSK